MLYGSAFQSSGNSMAFAYSSYSGGRIAVPVSASQFIYSQFEHVSGVPAPKGSEGVSISKLKVLDVLIDQLAQMKKQPQPALGASGKMTDEHIDALVEQYEKQIRTAQAAATAMPYLKVATPPTGAVFNLVA